MKNNPLCWTSSNPHSWMAAITAVDLWAGLLMNGNYELPETEIPQMVLT